MNQKAAKLMGNVWKQLKGMDDWNRQRGVNMYIYDIQTFWDGYGFW